MDEMKNVLKICLDKREIVPLCLKKIDEQSIKKNIKKISIFPLILEKIIIDYDNELAMITELNYTTNRENSKGFYYKGFFIDSGAVILRIPLSSYTTKISFSEVEDVEFNILKLKSKILFDTKKASDLQLNQIEIIDTLIKCDVNPFDTIEIYDIKNSLRILKIIDLIDMLIEQEIENIKEILNGVLKLLKVIEKDKLMIDKYNKCVKSIQDMCLIIQL